MVDRYTITLNHFVSNFSHTNHHKRILFKFALEIFIFSNRHLRAGLPVLKQIVRFGWKKLCFKMKTYFSSSDCLSLTLKLGLNENNYVANEYVFLFLQLYFSYLIWTNYSNWIWVFRPCLMLRKNYPTLFALTTLELHTVKFITIPLNKIKQIFIEIESYPFLTPQMKILFLQFMEHS